jgi:hypothetical protein
MDVMQTVYVCVWAGRAWNDSGVDIAPGQTYNFVVPGGEKWGDSRLSCGADGYTSAFGFFRWEMLRRVRQAKWQQLIATIGKSGRQSIIVGSRMMDFSPSSAGRLYFFANGLTSLHSKNNGMIAVRITRTK